MNESRLEQLAELFGVPSDKLIALLAELEEDDAIRSTRPDTAPGRPASRARIEEEPPTMEVSQDTLDELINELPHNSHISALIKSHDSVQNLAAAIVDSQDPSEVISDQQSTDDVQGALTQGPAGIFAGEHVLPGQANTHTIMSEEGKLFEDLGLLGMGGLGEVRKVRDISLGRSVAMKLLHPRFLLDPVVIARFIEEAQVTSQLQHPGIAPVHELGRTRDGRLYFTMKEIKGITLRDAIEEVHEASGRSWRASRSGWSFPRLLEVFVKICEAIAYAHKLGAVHRDLKPDNVMLGDLGEVLVVDWGLVKVMQDVSEGAEDVRFRDKVESVRSRNNEHQTMSTYISGTPAYMSPEQASGKNDELDHRADVYALGAILYEILSGRSPYSGDTPREILVRVLTGPPVPLEFTQMTASVGVENYTDTNVTNVWETSKLPKELVAVCERAMERAPEDRYASVEQMLEELKTWREGDHNRALARELISKAREALEEEGKLRARAASLREEARSMLDGFKPWDSEEAKAPAWELEDRARELALQTALKGLEAEQLLNGALLHSHNDEEAHIVLLERYKQQHRRAEMQRDREAQLRAEAQMVTHLYALPEEHPVKRSHIAYIKGDGRLTLVTSPAGAEVTARRYTLEHRRQVLEEPVSLGVTPLHSAPLPMGSYLLELRAPGHATTHYPVMIGRQDHWESIAPGDIQPHVIKLPREGQLEPDDVFIPAGWFWAGDDHELRHAMPKQKVWLDPFVIKRFHVTNRQFIEFLDDLALLGREAQAMRYVPRARDSMTVAKGAPIFKLEDEGFIPLVEGGLDAWEMDWPVTMITIDAAHAYAQWYSMRTGLVWRLPAELEWEKAARGADGRIYPWGDFFDPAWCCTEESHIEQAHPQVVNSYPTDASPYGVRGLAGNALDMCLDRWRPEGPLLEDGRALIDISRQSESIVRVARGSSWNRGEHLAKSFHRFLATPNLRADFLSFRLARSL